MKDSEERFLDIGPSGQKKRWVGFIGFAMFYVVVCTALIALFIFFTNSWTLAILLVGFMVIYMSVMGWLAMRREQDKDV